MGSERYQQAYEYIINRMTKEISPAFYYHNVPHVLDVLDSAIRIAKAEKISDSDLELLKVAVLFHDSGFIKSPINHEATSCVFAMDYLPGIGYSSVEIDIICKLIMATRVPHQPESLLEEIICDADLDYLGRSDFIPVSNTLFEELKSQNKMGSLNEWNKLQVKFISGHQYFTRTARRLREVNKQLQIKRIQSLIS